MGCPPSRPDTLDLCKVGLKILCTGYDIGGSGGCPHEPGACLVDEELYGGVCFEKCATLTGGAFPNRVGPLTCCDIHGLGCCLSCACLAVRYGSATPREGSAAWGPMASAPHTPRAACLFQISRHAGTSGHHPALA